MLPESLTLGQRTLEDVFLRAHRTGAGVMTDEPATFTPLPRRRPLVPPGAGAQAGMEARLMLRNGEQLLLAVVIPVIVLVGGVTGARPRRPRLRRTAAVDVFTPGVLALAVMSTSFTSLAIATGFERRYGVIKRLGSSPLPRSGLLAGKVGGAADRRGAPDRGDLAAWPSLLGWDPAAGRCLVAVLAVVLGTAAFAALGLFVAGVLRAEATLAAANLVYLLLLAGGAVVLPTSSYGAFGHVTPFLPSGALGDAMRQALIDGTHRVARPRRPARLGRHRHRPHRQDLHVGVTAQLSDCAARLAWATLVANIALVVTGGAVRLTGSGLGCPTWPRCNDELVHPARRASACTS